MGGNSDITFWSGLAAAALSFLVSWIYCVSEYGYLLGFGLGWLPSAILAGIVFAVVRYLWPLLFIGAAIIVVVVIR